VGPPGSEVEAGEARRRGAHVGAMQERMSGLLDHAARVLPDREVVSHWVGGALT